jgi:hypothetical protein
MGGKWRLIQHDLPCTKSRMARSRSLATFSATFSATLYATLGALHLKCLRPLASCCALYIARQESGHEMPPLIEKYSLGGGYDQAPHSIGKYTLMWWFWVRASASLHTTYVLIIMGNTSIKVYVLLAVKYL